MKIAILPGDGSDEWSVAVGVKDAGALGPWDLAGVAGKLLHCQTNWCEVDVGGYRGWLQKSEFWGVYPAETLE